MYDVGTGEYRVTDGHHRLAQAIANGQENIPTRTTFTKNNEGNVLTKSQLTDIYNQSPSTGGEIGGTTVYHGTSPQRAEIIKKEGFSINPKQETATIGKGVYFANDKGYSKLFSKGGDSSVIKAKLKPNLNIFDVKTSDDFVKLLGNNVNDRSPESITKRFQKLGYDGIRREGELVIFDPKNVSVSEEIPKGVKK